MTAEPQTSATFVLARDMSACEVQPFAGGFAAVYSTRHPERDGANEDAAALLPAGTERGVLAVADGFGGQPAGEEAARIALQELAASLAAEVPETGDLRGLILNGFENANRAVRELGVGAATTLAVLEVQGRTVRPYHVGDSTILIAGQRGKIKLQTVAHSPVGYAVESGLLDKRAALDHADRNVVSNMVGSPEMRIEVGAGLELAPCDTVLLASDGLFDNLHVDEIIQQMRKGPLAKALTGLVAASVERMKAPPPRDEKPHGGNPSKPDDLTLLAFRLNAPPRRTA